MMTTAHAQTPTGTFRSERTVSVSARGHVNAVPDRASIATGVVAEADTAKAALAASNAAMTNLIDGLKALGIAPKDIHTSGFSVNPRYTQAKDGRPATIAGYQVSNQVRILVRDLSALGQVMDTAVSLGANQMGGIEFHVGEAETLKDEARRQAIANALRRAKLFAAAAGAEVGEVIAIAEDMAAPSPRPMLMTRAAMAPGAVPIERGEQTLEVTVNVTWALK